MKYALNQAPRIAFIVGTMLITLHLSHVSALGAAANLDDVRALLDAGRNADAERSARALLPEIERLHGPDALETADVLDLLGRAIRRGGRPAGPELRAICERALRIKERVLGADSPGYATSLHNLAFTYYYEGDYARAESLNRKALEIRERHLGANHVDVAASLVSLAATRSEQGDHTAAKPLLDRALMIRESALGPDHPDVAETLNALAVILNRMGDYAGAGPTYLRAARVWEKSFGPDHPQVATCYHNLASLQAEMGETAQARLNYERALQIREKTLGREHEYVAHTVAGLASTYRDEGDLATAQSYYRRALAIQEKRFGPDHHDVGWMLARLGEIEIDRGNYAGAKPILEGARVRLEKGLGMEHPEVADVLIALAAISASEQDSGAAVFLYRHALAIQEKAYGPNHPEVGKSLTGLAQFLANAGDYRSAVDAALRAEELGREHLRVTARSLAERQALSYASSRPSGMKLALSILARHPERDAETIARVWDSAIRSRALVLDEMSARTRAIGEVTHYARALDEARERLSNLLVRGASGDSPASYRAAVDRAREDVEQAERTLAVRSTTFRWEQARARVGWTEVSASLPSRSALVAFCVAGDGTSEAYVAFVLSPTARAASLVTLGPTEEINALISTWAREAGQGAQEPGRSPRRAEDTCRAAGDALRRRIWDPIASHLGGADRVFVVPEGPLHLVSLAALPAGEGGYVVERGAVIHYVSTERDLVPPQTEEARGKGLLALGGPAFDARPATAVTAVVARDASGRARGDDAPPDGRRGAPYECEEFRKVRFRPLPGSLREVQEIDSIWKSHGDATVLSGAAATESGLRERARGRRVLHLATHGFFLGAMCGPSAGTSRGIGGVAPAGRKPPPAAVREEYRPQLSGLALAGANNRAWAGLDDEDGILTDQEIASMDLRGVEWVVLSACETGLGEIRTGEGVLGLRRAFKVAGAGTLIMSLWAVDDEASRAWMRALYDGRLIGHLGTAEAVREAGIGALRDLRARGRSTHPFYWAAFVAAGDWR